jgi:hypothetical protein
LRNSCKRFKSTPREEVRAPILRHKASIKLFPANVLGIHLFLPIRRVAGLFRPKEISRRAAD